MGCRYCCQICSDSVDRRTCYDAASLRAGGLRGWHGCHDRLRRWGLVAARDGADRCCWFIKRFDELLGLLVANTRYREEERTTLTMLAFRPYPPFHRLGKTTTEVQPKAGASDLARVTVVDAIEFLEQVRQIFGRNTDSSVLDAYLDFFFVPTDID